MATEIIQINTQNLESQTYESQDTNLIPTFDVNTSLTSGSYIEYFVYDLNQNLLYTEYNFTQYKVLNDGQSAGTGVLSQIELNPENDLTRIGYDQGSYISYYNFLNKKIGSNLEQLYISEISSDRTEIRLDSTILSNQDIVEQTSVFIDERENSEYFLDFYVNFGDNILYIANNIALDNEDPNNPTILIKLYEPLPAEFNINSTLWVVSSVEEPIAYQVNFIEEPIVFDDTIKIKGPNFNIELKDQVNNSTQELSYTDLITTSLTSSQNQLNSLLEEKEIDINVDYTNFEDFIHFSSAQTRLENFYYKISLIEQYSSSIAILNNTNSSSLAVSQSTAVYEAKINEIITNFDGWDYYLYYSSGSWAWPKTNTEPPYQLATTGSAAVLNWFGNTNEYNPQYGGIILSASLYDGNNKDNLLFSIPEYLREDPANEPYELFIDMVAQHFDNIWIYYKDVTNKYNADNRLEYGISKDIVADAIRNFGIKLYQNNFSNQDLYTAFLGLTPEGGLFPFPNITGSLPTPSGFEYVDTLISASNDYLPLDDVNKSLYKRIYHNLPYLLKSKGTLPGLRALITSYGIPDTILRINEYGGKDKIDSNDWDYWQNEFNYAYSTEGDNFISSSWALNNDWYSPDNVPSTLAFRFKSPELPYSSIRYSQSLWSNDLGSAIVLTYTGSAYNSGSYSGSIIDPYYQYATLTFYPDITEPASSSNVYLPFFNGGWWSVMVNRSGSDFTLHAANKIYEGGDNGTILGFYASSSINGDSTPWVNSIYSYFPISFSVGTLAGLYDVVTYDNTALYDSTGSLVGTYIPFSGSYQEIRYYNTVISPDVFKDYTMNPYSTEGNLLNSSPNELAFRASIGGELYTASISCHPKVTGSWVTTHSFASNSNFYYDITPNFIVNREYFFYDQPIAGIKNAVSDKIRLENDNIPSGSTLSPFRRLAQTTEASASYTAGTNLLEVAFSPQDEINDDINSQIGYFNIGDFIGDPSFRSSRLTSYPNLDQLRNEYFEKYTKNYNLVDFIRLIKFFDNSLFKMIRDFVPARTSLASGVVIKQTLLERNRYPEPQVDNHTTIAKYGRSGSIIWNEPIIVQDISVTGSVNPQWNDYNEGTIERFSGGTAGTFEPFNGINTSPYGADGNGPDNRFFITQSWTESYPTLSGSVSVVHSSQDEFYDGEFSGSVILVTTQSLNQPYPLDIQAFEYTPIIYENSLYEKTYYSIFTENQFLSNSYLYPNQGEILILIPRWKVKTPNIIKEEAYVKINKFDCNGKDNTTPLGQITNLLIKYTSDTTYTNYEILNIYEYSTYYLYEIANQNIDLLGAGMDNYVKDYTIVASNSNTYLVSNSQKLILTSSYNPNNFYDDLTGYYTVDQVPNIKLDFTMSWDAYADNWTSISDNAELSFYMIETGSTFAPQTLLAYSGPNIYLTSSATQSYVWSGSLNPYTNIFGDNLINQLNNIYFLAAVNKDYYTGDINYSNFTLEINQNTTPTTPVCDPVILEPYITTPNFYNSDENAFINNIFEDRLSTQYQDVDYSTGALIPTNFDLLIEGDAQKAPVQDSNYSTLRHINPRYNGSKTTSQRLNTWSPPNTIPNYSDEGTYGKLSTIDSLKTAIAYCDFIGGWPPERMNASGAHILYLIKADGTVIIPNTSENSLYDNKGTFESGERVSISTQTTTITGENNFRTIIRGGTRIEPILYTQIGHSPALWTSSINLVSSLPIQDSSSYGDYQAKYNALVNTYPDDNNLYPVRFDQIISSGSGVSWGTDGKYIVTPNAILDNVDLTFTGKVIIDFVNNIGGLSAARNFYLNIRLTKFDGVNNITLDEDSLYFPFNSNNSTERFTLNVSHHAPAATLQVGHQYFVQIQIPITTPDPSPSFPGDYTATISTDSIFSITQYPNPTNYNIEVTGSNTVWGYPNPTNYPFVITSSHPVLVSGYGDPYIKQENISGSGFNSIELPWSIKYGDEFRFEGNENQVYMVKQIYAPGEQSVGRLFNTSSIEVHFNAPLPVSSSTSIFNLNHFLIRRYMDDASLILLEGYKPTGAEGPFLIKPEFVTPELNKSIDQVIVDLTQKGLL